ncbi:MAG: hypothetical protein CMM78_10520 [Rhodospirillaceae bacterium]|nr:hypothetical protein [Rhodospirillales bacterium]MAX48631.1 hypothetical protein [Rhodospirillaceae bacterium]
MITRREYYTPEKPSATRLNQIGQWKSALFQAASNWRSKEEIDTVGADRQNKKYEQRKGVEA